MATITIYHAFKGPKPQFSQVHESEFDVQRKRIKTLSSVIDPSIYDRIESLALNAMGEREFETGRLHLWKFEIKEDVE